MSTSDTCSLCGEVLVAHPVLAQDGRQIGVQWKGHPRDCERWSEGPQAWEDKYREMRARLEARASFSATSDAERTRG